MREPRRGREDMGDPMRVDYISDETVLEIIRDNPDIGAHDIARIGYPALWEEGSEFRAAKHKLYNQLQRLKKYNRIQSTGSVRGDAKAYTWRAKE